MKQPQRGGILDRFRGKKDADLTPKEGFPDCAWQPGQLDADLRKVQKWVEGEAESAIAWYLDAKRPKSHWSKRLRFIAIALTTAGALVPFLAAISGDDIPVEWGYVLLALAAGAVGFDRFFGFSTAWMRYLTADMTLHQLLQRFRFERAAAVADRGGREPAPDLAIEELKAMAKTADEIQAVVRDETATWVAEFQSNIKELTTISASREQPGVTPASQPVSPP